jgi:hypothetical protein
VIVRGVGRAIAGLALVLAVSACDDNPLAENREEAAYFRLNPSSAAVNAGGEVDVTATVLNRYGAATNAPVTGTPCDSRITAEPDSTRSEFEFPERFTVTGGELGLSCLVVSGGGLTDTIQIRVVPASVEITPVDTVLSGETFDADIVYLSEAGTAATGFDQAQVTWTALDDDVADIDDQGVITGFAPGTARVVARLASLYSATRVDTLEFEVVAGPFSGTLSSDEGVAGEMITINAGAIEFDDDTEVFFDGIQSFIHSMTPTTMQVVVGPSETPETQLVISNLGESQVSSTVDFTVTSNVDPTEPNNGLATAVPSAVGDTLYLVVDATDFSDLVRYTVAAETDVELFVDWFLGDTDVDVYFYDATGTEVDGDLMGGCASAAHPEHCVNTLPVGSTYFRVYNWAQDETRTYTLVRVITQVAAPE